jgi:hypothetical protein
MKTKVIEFFQNLPEAPHEQFNQAFVLYRESEGKNASVERAVNARGYSTSALDNLLYDLQKLHGITDVEKVAPVKVLKLEVGSDGEEGSLELDPNSEVPGTQEQTSDTDALKEENEELKSALRQAQDDGEDLQSEKEELESEKEDLQDENEELKAEVETLKLAPKLDAKKLRVEFPFLNEKDCPDELKILMADKITAWNRYLSCQEELAKIESGEIVETDLRKADLAKNAIDAFTENQKIYDELNAYQTTGKVLGSHPIFKKLQLTREVETMTNDELIKYKSASAKYFSDNKGLLAKAVKAGNEPRILEINTRVADREMKLALVNKKLGVK